MATIKTEELKLTSSDNFDLNDLVDEDEDITKQNQLHNKYSFWFHRRGTKGASYEDSMTKIASCQTVSGFTECTIYYLIKFILNTFINFISN